MRRVIKHSYLYLAIYLSSLLIADYTIAQNPPVNNSDDETFQRVFGRPRPLSSTIANKPQFALALYLVNHSKRASHPQLPSKFSNRSCVLKS